MVVVRSHRPGFRSSHRCSRFTIPDWRPRRPLFGTRRPDTTATGPGRGSHSPRLRRDPDLGTDRGGRAGCAGRRARQTRRPCSPVAEVVVPTGDHLHQIRSMCSGRLVVKPRRASADMRVDHNFSAMPKAIPRTTVAVLRPTPPARSTPRVRSGPRPRAAPPLIGHRHQVAGLGRKKPVERIKPSSSEVGLGQAGAVRNLEQLRPDQMTHCRCTPRGWWPPGADAG